MGDNKLKSGYTTGTCAALAAKASTLMLFSGSKVDEVSVLTPKGITINVNVLDIQIEKDNDKEKVTAVSCAVKKDAGDDPDVTNGILVYAKVSFSNTPGIDIDGGVGIGRVTRPGLSVSIGNAAINPVPMRMIADSVHEVMDEYGYVGGMKVMISVPEGVEIAKKTFNPRLGIEGGISIIGTTGIVEPMSQQALLDTIKLEMNVAKASGAKGIVIVPGNYGKDYIKEELKLDVEKAITCSNYVGDSLDYALELGFEYVLLVGHIGKFVKLAAGIFNTHSHIADGRMETLGVHFAMQGGRQEAVSEIMNCVSTDEAIRIIKEEMLFDETMQSIADRIDYHLKQRVRDMKMGLISFSNVHGLVCKTRDADEILNNVRFV